MAYSQSDLDKLDRAILASELEVEIDGTRVKYRHMDELLAARRHVADVITSAQSATQRAGGSFRYEFTTGRD